MGAFLLGSSPALAANTAISEPERLHLSYAAPLGCPNREHFLSLVRGRVKTAWLAAETEVARPIRITLESTQGEFVAHLQYRDEFGQDITRSVQAPDCEQAVAGIALVTAIAIESLLEPRAFALPSNDERQAGVPATGPESSAPAPTPASNDQQSSTHSSASPVANPTWGRASKSAPISQEFAASIGGQYGLGPGAALGGGFQWGAGPKTYPLVKVAATWYEYRQSPSSSELSLTSRFRLISGTAQLCGARPWYGLRSLIGALCGGLEVGQYRTAGETEYPRLFNTHTLSWPWLALQIAIPARMTRGRIFFEFLPLIRVPLVSSTFDIQVNGQTRTVYKTPRIALGLSLGIGLQFAD